MSAPPADRIVRDARIRDDDTPHEAAAHLWAQVVASHDVDPDGDLTQLGVLERVVLVMVDVMGLSTATVAQVLNTSPESARSSLDHARARIGLPSTGAVACAGREEVRAGHAPGDPAALPALRAHVRDCPTCSDTVADDQARTHRWSLRRAGRTAAPAAIAVTGPALAGTAAVAAAAVVTTAVAVGALTGSVPEPPLPQPVVVDADPDLPSDEEPAEGWPEPITEPNETTATTGADQTAPKRGTTAQDDDLDDTLDQTVDDLGDTLHDTVDDVGDAVDAVDDTLEETVDPVEDAVDDTTDTLDETADTLDDTASEGSDLLP